MYRIVSADHWHAEMYKGDAKTCTCHRRYVSWRMQTNYQHERAVPAVVL